MNREFLFQHGMVYTGSTEIGAGSIPWNPHPSFRGVSMKDLISGSDTAGRLSCHLVRIEPFCAIGAHSHDGRMELHEVIEGGGICVTGDARYEYTPGVVTVIHDNMRHAVEAGESGLLLLAKFSPALV